MLWNVTSAKLWRIFQERTMFCIKIRLNRINEKLFQQTVGCRYSVPICPHTLPAGRILKRHFAKSYELWNVWRWRGRKKKWLFWKSRAVEARGCFIPCYKLENWVERALFYPNFLHPLKVTPILCTSSRRWKRRRGNRSRKERREEVVTFQWDSNHASS